MHAGHVLLRGTDGVPAYACCTTGPWRRRVSHADTGGHTHRWEHVVYVLQGAGTLVCEGKRYAVSEGDGVVVPPQVQHQWRNDTQAPRLGSRLTRWLEAHEG